MDNVARMDPHDRRDLFSEVAGQRGDITAAIIEKDFWVCWTLKHIFALGPTPAQLIFKGGTSLSKVYGIIERFSEDIDLSISREDLGFVGDRDPYKATSGKKEQALIKEIVARCREVIKSELLPRLHAQIESVLGPGDTASPWRLTVDKEDDQSLLFFYPASIESGNPEPPTPYVRRVVLLELGARSDHWPTEERFIKSYAAETMPEQFSEPECLVRTLSAERTFWEKATLLHAEAHKPFDKASGARFSRHYYDMAKLYQSAIGPQALANRQLLTQVVAHKNLFFRSSWANYDTAIPGTFRIVPPLERYAAIRNDYQTMQETMIFGKSYSFDELIMVLSELEAKLNVQT